jgi:serine protease Do
VGKPFLTGGLKMMNIKTKMRNMVLAAPVSILVLLLVWFFSPIRSSSEAAVTGQSDSNPCPCSFSQLVKKVSPGVVNISAVKVLKGTGPFQFGSPDNPFHDFFKRFYGDQLPKEFKQKGLGSGFIIDKDGYILTNNHVVENAEEIQVKLSDDRKFPAKIVGRDPKTDLALIRIKADTPLEPLTWGDSDKLQVGDWVIAIGSPFGLGNTVTAGIVSAKYRHIGQGAYDDFIQTDASINPGNSGGPLLNTAGEVVGINTAIFSGSGGNIGIGFAIPSNIAKDLLPQLKKGKVIRGWLGVLVQEITPEISKKFNLKGEHGALVSQVTPGSPADKAGIERGDVIVSFDGKPIKEMHDLPYIVASTPVGKRVSVDVIRKGEKKTLEVEVGQMKEEAQQAEATEEAPDLGLTLKEITPEMAQNYKLPETTGLVVVKVEADSPGDEAGLKPGDVILEVDREKVQTLEQFKAKISKYKKGGTILFLINRGGSTLYTTVEVP